MTTQAVPGTVVPVGAQVSPGGGYGPQGPSGAEVGSIKAWPSVTPPATWMIMDGSAISRTLYPNLYSLIGTTFGAGDGSTTFNLPDARGQFILPAGQGSGLTNRVLGATGGEETHVLVTGELAAHNHTATQGSHSHTIGSSINQSSITVGTGAQGPYAFCFTPANGTAFITNATSAVSAGAITIGNNGSGTGHNTMPPFLVLTYIIKVSGGGGATAQAPIADTTQAGLLNKVSGSANDYIGGDNACHPLVPPQLGGYLKLVSATQLSFLPFKGLAIQINGAVYQIPTTGVVGLANTNVYVNGVAAQNLAASTLYRVYCFNNAGVLTADFSTTAHATSLTAGNVGTEIESGDDTRTFIGLIYTNASSQFVDSSTQRCVRSWVNRDRASFTAGTSGGFSSTTFTVLANTVISLVAFANEALTASGMCYGTGTVSANFLLQMNLDGTAITTSACTTTGTTGKYEPTAVAGAWNVSEGLRTVALYSQMTSGTFNGNWAINGMLG